MLKKAKYLGRSIDYQVPFSRVLLGLFSIRLAQYLTTGWQNKNVTLLWRSASYETASPSFQWDILHEDINIRIVCIQPSTFSSWCVGVGISIQGQTLDRHWFGGWLSGFCTLKAVLLLDSISPLSSYNAHFLLHVYYITKIKYSYNCLACHSVWWK